MFIVLYADDLLVTGSSKVGVSKIKAFLMTKFAMKGLGDVSLILGMQVSRDRLKGTLGINQGNYVKAILQRFGFVDSRSVSTPGTGNPLNLTRNSAGRWQQAAISRNCGKSHLFIDVNTLGHCLLRNAANSGN